MNLFKTYKDHEGQVNLNRRQNADAAEIAFKIVGAIFTVCFPLAVALLFSMTKDIHNIAEQMSSMAAKQEDLKTTVEAQGLKLSVLVGEAQGLRERLAIAETKLAEHQAKQQR